MSDLTLDDMRGADIIDTRDIIERIAALEGQDSEDDGSGLDEFEREELVALATLVEDYGDYFGDSWRFGVTLIADSYFEDYAQEFARDIGAVPDDLAWPACHIDWEAAASSLKQDYSSIEIAGTTYWGQA